MRAIRVRESTTAQNRLAIKFFAAGVAWRRASRHLRLAVVNDRPEPLLLPRPRRITLTGGRCRMPRCALVIGGDPTASVGEILCPLRDSTSVASPSCNLLVKVGDDPDAESYRLTIPRKASASILIESPGPRGARYAAHTLRQLLRQYGRNLPALEVVDAPAFPHRGVMLDVSRDRVPRMDELLRIVDQLAGWKVNHLQIYTEHTFRYRRHRDVWRRSSPFSPAEVRRLDLYCRSRGITLAANQNCFGHLQRWLKHPRYAPLAETDGPWEWNGRMLPGPFSICPTDPRSIELIRDLLGQLLPNFTSGLVNIGCDEALDVGQGRSRDEVAWRGGAAVYFEFVSKVAAIARRHGFRPLFWADIALSHPESLALIPKDLIALAWGYEPDAPFAAWCRRLREVGREVWVCPGTSSWRSITGRTTERRGNIAAAVAAGLAEGATGLLMTDWGDDGHRQQWPVALIGLAEAADAAWSGLTYPPDDRALGLHAFNDPTGDVVRWLLEIGDADLPVRRIAGLRTARGWQTPLRNASALFLELHRPLSEPGIVESSKARWALILQYISTFKHTLPSRIDPQVRAELALTAEVAQIAALFGCHRSPPGESSINVSDTILRLRRVIREHRRLWKPRSRPGGLDDSCAHYERVIANLLELSE